MEEPQNYFAASLSHLYNAKNRGLQRKHTVFLLSSLIIMGNQSRLSNCIAIVQTLEKVCLKKKITKDNVTYNVGVNQRVQALFIILVFTLCYMCPLFPKTALSLAVTPSLWVILASSPYGKAFQGPVLQRVPIKCKFQTTILIG